MTDALLLDEMFHPRIAEGLTTRGRPTRAVVTDPLLRESSDVELVQRAVAANYVVVTNNVVDFERIRRHRTAAGEPVPGLIYTILPRDRRFIGRSTDALQYAESPQVTGGVLWLQPR